MARRADDDWLTQRALAFGHSRIIQVGRDLYVYPPGSEPAPRAPAALPAGPERLVGRAGKVGELLDG